MKLQRDVTYMDCAVTGNGRCGLANIKSQPHGRDGRSDWYECDHGHIIQVVVHRWIK